MSIERLYTKLSQDEAITLAGSGWWKELPARDVALAQLQQARLCMDFGDFHKAVQEAAGRPVFTHEFVNNKHLAREIDPSLPDPDGPRKTMADMMGKNATILVVESP